MFVPTLVVVFVVEFFGFDVQLGATDGLGGIAVRDLLESEQEDVLVPPGTADCQGSGGGGLHDELGSGDEALCGCVSEYLHRYLAANAMGFADPGHLELHGFL